MENVTSDIFEPAVFQAMVDAMQPSRNHVLYNQVRKDTTPLPFVQWTVRGGAFSELAEFNAPNAKANVIPAQPRKSSAGQASLAYMREGDVFSPTVALLTKDIEANRPEAVVPAERMIADEVQVVNERINNRIEWMLWQSLQGGFEYTGANTGTLTVDYGMRSDHKITLAEPWDLKPSMISLINAIRNATLPIQKHGGTAVTDVFLTRATFDLVIQAFTDAAVSNENRSMLTDAMINQFYATGEVRGFFGVDRWKTVDAYYDVRQPDGSVKVVPYLPHGTVLFTNLVGSDLRYTQGPSFDFDAPLGKIGRFSKTFTQPDPSTRAFLIEESGLPVLKAPDSTAVVKVASPAWVGAQTW